MKKVAIVPKSMHNIVERAGYLPAIRVDNLLVMSGQVGRDAQLAIPADPEQQFRLCWDNLALVLAEAGCTFEDVIDMTTYHVNMSTHMPVFRQVKNERFPLGTCCWTCIGVSELAHPGLLVEIKCTALIAS